MTLYKLIVHLVGDLTTRERANKDAKHDDKTYWNQQSIKWPVSTGASQLLDK